MEQKYLIANMAYVIVKDKKKTERYQKNVGNYVAEFFFPNISRSALSYTRLYNFCLNI